MPVTKEALKACITRSVKKALDVKVPGLKHSVRVEIAKMIVTDLLGDLSPVFDENQQLRQANHDLSVKADVAGRRAGYNAKVLMKDIRDLLEAHDEGTVRHAKEHKLQRCG